MRALLVVLLTACGASSPPPAQPEPAAASGDTPTEGSLGGSHGVTISEETVCSDVEECVLIPGPCGEAAAVNRAHEAEVRARNEQLASVASCAAPSPATYRVACTGGVCTAVEDGVPLGS